MDPNSDQTEARIDFPRVQQAAASGYLPVWQCQCTTDTGVQVKPSCAEKGGTELGRASDMLSEYDCSRTFCEEAVLALYQSTFDGRIIAANAAFVQMFGYADVMQLRSNVQYIPRDLFVYSEQYGEIVQRVLEHKVERGFEVLCRRKDGSRFVGNLHLWAVKDPDGRVLRLEGCIEDITERAAMEEKLRYLSTHDALTGLYNRWHFEQEMERLRHGCYFPISILVADLDDLKWVNDHEGHLAGDRHLQQTAHLLLEGCRADDIVARIGGDEFAVILPHADASTAERVASHLRQALTSHNLRRAGAALSLALGVATAEAGESLFEVYRRADERMYQDKARRGETRRQ